MQNILTGRTVIIVFIIVAIFVIGCILWYQREARIADEELAATLARIQKPQASKSKQAEQLPAQISSETSETTPADLTTEAGSTGEVLLEVIDAVSDTGSHPEIDDTSETATEETTDEDARESPFGFGSYPLVPLGLFPHGEEVWDEIEAQAKRDWEFAKELELMVRVRIKFWELGTETVGISSSNGLFYPSIPDVAYVSWGWKKGEDGERKRYVTGIRSPAGMSLEVEEMIEAGQTPPGWTIMDYDTAGIDPYTFLELE